MRFVMIMLVAVLVSYGAAHAGYAMGDAVSAPHLQKLCSPGKGSSGATSLCDYYLLGIMNAIQSPIFGIEGARFCTEGVSLESIKLSFLRQMSDPTGDIFSFEAAPAYTAVFAAIGRDYPCRRR